MLVRVNVRVYYPELGHIHTFTNFQKLRKHSSQLCCVGGLCAAIICLHRL